MIDHELFAAILAAPEQDALRLVLADWLEGHGDLARADLIRWQCQVARLPHWDRDHREASWHVEHLLLHHAARWRAELPVLDGVTWTDFHRGFVSTVRVRDLAALYEHDDAIVRAAPVFRVELASLDESQAPWRLGSVPWLRELLITNADAQVILSDPSLLSVVRELELVDLGHYTDLMWLAAPVLERLRCSGEHTLGADFARRLARTPSRLARLEMATNFVDYNSGYFQDPTLGVAGARSLGEHTALEALDVGGQRIESTGLGLLLALPRLRELVAREVAATELPVLDEVVAPKPAAAVMKRSGGKRVVVATGGGKAKAKRTSTPDLVAIAEGVPLARLDLSRNPIGADGLHRLAMSARFRALESLALDTCEIGALGLEALIASPCWATLRELDLSRNPLGESGVRALTHAPVPPQLWSLGLADVDGDAKLVEIPWLRQLGALDLSGNHLHHRVRALAELPRLRSLAVAHTRIEPASLGQLVEQLVHLDLTGNTCDALARAAPELQTLSLRAAPIPDDELASWAAGARYPKLRVLDLAHLRRSSPAVLALLDWQSLERLDLSHCELASAFASAVAEREPPPLLRTLNLRGNVFAEAALVALAQSERWRHVELLLTANPWSFTREHQTLLAARFGDRWHQDPEAQ